MVKRQGVMTNPEWYWNIRDPEEPWLGPIGFLAAILMVMLVGVGG